MMRSAFTIGLFILFFGKIIASNVGKVNISSSYTLVNSIAKHSFRKLLENTFPDGKIMYDREMFTEDCTIRSTEINVSGSLDSLSDRLMISAYHGENNTSILLNVNNIDAQLRVSLTCGKGSGDRTEKKDDSSYFSQVSDNNLLLDIKNFGFNAQLAFQDSNDSITTTSSTINSSSTSSKWDLDDIQTVKTPQQVPAAEGGGGLKLLNVQASYESLALNSTISPLLAQFILLCPEDAQEKEGTLCFPKCKDGFDGIQRKCIQTCSDGFKDIGDTCLKPLPEFRGYGYALWDFDKCSSRHHETSCELCLLMYFPKCRSGFHAIGASNCNYCRSSCANGQRDMGHSCEKIQYDRGSGVSADIDKFIQIWIEENHSSIQELIQNNVVELNHLLFEKLLNKASFSWYGVDMKLYNTNISQPLISEEPEITEKYIQVRLEGGLDYDDDGYYRSVEQDDSFDSSIRSFLPLDWIDTMIDQSGTTSTTSSVQLAFSESILNDAFNLLLGSGVIQPINFKGKFNTLFSVNVLSGELEFNEVHVMNNRKNSEDQYEMKGHREEKKKNDIIDKLVKGDLVDDSYFFENNDLIDNIMKLKEENGVNLFHHSVSNHESTIASDDIGVIVVQDSVHTENSDLITSKPPPSANTSNSFSLYLKASVKVTSNEIEYTVPASVLLDLSIPTDNPIRNKKEDTTIPGAAAGVTILATISNVKLNFDCDTECEQCKISQLLLRSFQEIMDDLINNAYDSEMGKKSIDIKLPIFPFLLDTLPVNNLTIHVENGRIQVAISNKNNQERDINSGDDILLRGRGGRAASRTPTPPAASAPRTTTATSTGENA